MDTPPPTRSRAGRVVGTCIVAVAFGFFFFAFWFFRFLFKDSEEGGFGHGKSLDDLLWSHLGSMTLFAALGALTVWLLWVRPDRRLRIALAGGQVGVLTTAVFYLVLGQFSLVQGVGFVFFSFIVMALMVISAIATAVLLGFAITIVISRRRAC